MKQLIILLFAITANFAGYSQDIIIKTNGVKIACKIQNEDISTVYYSFKNLEAIIDTSIEKSEVASIKYGKDFHPKSGDYTITMKHSPHVFAMAENGVPIITDDNKLKKLPNGVYVHLNGCPADFKSILYFQHGQNKTFEEMKIILKNDPASFPAFKKYLKYRKSESVFYTMGGLMIVGGVATALATKEKYGSTWVTGVVIATVGLIPWSLGGLYMRASKRQFINTIDVYNGVSTSSSLNSIQFNLMVSSNEIGIGMRF